MKNRLKPNRKWNSRTVTALETSLLSFWSNSSHWLWPYVFTHSQYDFIRFISLLPLQLLVKFMCHHSAYILFTQSFSLSVNGTTKRLQCYIPHELKKQYNLPFSITLPTVDLFSKFFHQWTQQEICNEVIIKDVVLCISKNMLTLASSGFDKHRLILIVFTKQHQYTFKSDVPIQLSLSLHLCLFCI